MSRKEVGMVRLEGVIDVRQRPEVVFDAVADERSVYDPNVIRAEMLTDGPLGVGTRFRSVVQGRRAPVETVVTITGYDRPHRLCTTTVAKGVEIASDIGVSAIPAGTHVRWSCDLRPSGPLRLLGPILGIVAKRQTARVWEALRAELDRRPAHAAAGVRSAVP